MDSHKPTVICFRNNSVPEVKDFFVVANVLIESGCIASMPDQKRKVRKLSACVGTFVIAKDQLLGDLRPSSAKNATLS